MALGASALILLSAFQRSVRRKKRKGQILSYDDLIMSGGSETPAKGRVGSVLTLVLSCFFTLVYLAWRVCFSVPTGAGVSAVAANVLLLGVEVLGFAESLILFHGLFRMRPHPLPEIPEDAWPEVDVFIATYNEPVELLRRTVNGCTHMRYLDPAKVHIWVCDDKRRPEMRRLAEEMGVGNFDRPDIKGAKAGKGDKLFLYTDGVPEATDAENELFGTARMIDALNACADRSPEALLACVKSAVDVFVGEAEQFDDLTMLCLEYKGVFPN